MKTLIVAVNSKYIHTSLAPWYLKANCREEECGDIEIMEFSINDNPDSVLADIYKEKANVMAFSCYIWNIGFILRLAENLKNVMPDLKIALGGPEVSFDAVKLAEENEFINYIMIGEGERIFPQLLHNIFTGRETDNIEGLVARNVKKAASDPEYQLIDHLDSISSPYTDEMLSNIGNRIVYFESSRGCPFSCSYCLSSTFDGVRYFSIERVKSDLNRIIDAGVVQVKFVDRTFNCSRQRAKDIFRFIVEKSRQGLKTNFHFEVAADLFDDEMFDILKSAPVGLIQFEIGVQTTNEKVLEAISRKTDLKRLFQNAESLRNIGNTHLHMDLIAGLPEENLSSFKKSFNEVYSFRPHQLQLGFLKLLKGSNIRRYADDFGYVYRAYPPYEVLYNKFMSFDDMLLLKDIEEMVERYYNSGRFHHTLKFMIKEVSGSAFEFYEKLSEFYRKQGYMDKPPSGRTLYSIMNDFAKSFNDNEGYETVNELLKLDFLASDNSNNLPEGIQRVMVPGFKEGCFEFLRKEENIKAYLPHYAGMPAKQVFKSVHFEIFKYDFMSEDSFKRKENIYLFNYNKRNRVTGLYEYTKISGLT